MSNLILVIEDNEKNLLLMRDILTYRHYEVIEARDGESGIKMAKERKPDLIIMDIQMPVMDGFSATKILKRDPQTKEIKIIGVTSFAMKGDKERILAAGFDDYISKPIDTRQLPELIKKYIG